MVRSPVRDREREIASGDFYVEPQCCMTCGVPQAIAPDLVGWREQGNLTTCYRIKQPQTPTELDRAIEVLQAHYLPLQGASRLGTAICRNPKWRYHEALKITEKPEVS